MIEAPEVPARQAMPAPAYPYPCSFSSRSALLTVNDAPFRGRARIRSIPRSRDGKPPRWARGAPIVSLRRGSVVWSGRRRGRCGGRGGRRADGRWGGAAGLAVGPGAEEDGTQAGEDAAEPEELPEERDREQQVEHRDADREALEHRRLGTSERLQDPGSDGDGDWCLGEVDQKGEERERDEDEGYGDDEDAREEQGDRHRDGGDEPDSRAPQPFGAQRADDRGRDSAREDQGREPDEKGRGRGEKPPDDPLEGHP